MLTSGRSHFDVVTACLLDNEPTSCVLAARLSTVGCMEPKRKRVLIGRFIVARSRRETLLSTLDQVEVSVTGDGGPN